MESSPQFTQHLPLRNISRHAKHMTWGRATPDPRIAFMLLVRIRTNHSTARVWASDWLREQILRHPDTWEMTLHSMLGMRKQAWNSHIAGHVDDVLHQPMDRPDRRIDPFCPVRFCLQALIGEVPYSHARDVFKNHYPTSDQWHDVKRVLIDAIPGSEGLLAAIGSWILPGSRRIDPPGRKYLKKAKDPAPDLRHKWGLDVLQPGESISLRYSSRGHQTLASFHSQVREEILRWNESHPDHQLDHVACDDHSVMIFRPGKK